ncbi:PucR family transcriptional regulator [Saccharopolyspora hattusasensis]|uniref:PucR family transcriptional regulator n=1 Tax=Saccharopolyspora hattusasensis TaxID=1128679 RepID=UPI003D9A07DA
MVPTLREVLQFEPFRRASARVVAADDALDVAVRWVHISEMPDSGRLFQGGELLLTQGRGIASEASAQRAWIRELARAGIAGVAVEVGVVLHRIPGAMCDEARHHGLPVIELQHPAYFMDITEAVHTTIINSRVGAMQRAESAGRRIARLALDGGSLTETIDELARSLDHPVVVSDAAGEVLAYAPQTAETDRRVGNWAAHARVGHTPTSDGLPSRTTAGGTTCVWAAIPVRGECWGSVHVLEPGDPTDEAGRLILDRAATAIGLAFAKDPDAGLGQQNARSVFVHDLVGGHVADQRELRLRAAAFGIDLSGSFRVLVFRPLERSERLRAVATSARRLLASDAGDRVLTAYDGGQLLTVLGGHVHSPDDVRARAEQVAETCYADHGVPVVAGISDPVPVTGLPRAFADAADAVRYATRIGRERGVLLSGDLGIDRLLIDLDRAQSLSRHIERELGALLDHDATASTPLLPTLQVYLEHSGRKAEAARVLSIERRTLYYRIEKITRLLNVSLEDPDVNLRLLIALRGLEFRRRIRNRS